MDNFWIWLGWMQVFAIVAQSFNEFNFFAEALWVFHVGEYSINYADYLLHVLREGLFDERTTIQQLVYVCLCEGQRGNLQRQAR